MKRTDLCRVDADVYACPDDPPWHVDLLDVLSSGCDLGKPTGAVEACIGVLRLGDRCDKGEGTQLFAGGAAGI